MRGVGVGGVGVGEVGVGEVGVGVLGSGGWSWEGGVGGWYLF